jgi:hypothetical protein
MRDDKRTKIRKHIRNGNPKTLWDAVKVAKDKNKSSVPEIVRWNNIKFSNGRIAEAFAEFFEDKVNKIVKDTETRTDVYKGRRLFLEKDEDFMQPIDVIGVLKNLKIKNCEGYDRLPLRILSKGAELLTPLLTALFQKIYKERKVPKQLKTAKIIPLHKKVTLRTSPIIGRYQTCAPYPRYSKN